MTEVSQEQRVVDARSGLAQLIEQLQRCRAVRPEQQSDVPHQEGAHFDSLPVPQKAGLGESFQLLHDSGGEGDESLRASGGEEEFEGGGVVAVDAVQEVAYFPVLVGE